ATTYDRLRADVTRYTSYTPSQPRTAFRTCPRCLGSPISKVKREVATRSREVWTAAERMLTCWSDRTRVTSDRRRERSRASTWMATRKTEDWVGAHSTSRIRSGCWESEST